MIVFGIDPSLTHCTIVSSSGREWQCQPKTRGPERLIEIREFIHNYIYIECPDLVVLEGYSYGSPFAAHPIGELGGVLRVKLMELGYSEANKKLIIVPPTKVKKFVTSRGNAKKNEMMMRVMKKWGYEAKDDNYCDAYSLMKLGELGEQK